MSLLLCTGFERLLTSVDATNVSLSGATTEGAGGGLVQYQAATRTGGDGSHCIRATANIGMNWQPPLNATTDATVYIKVYVRCTALPTTGNKLFLLSTSDTAGTTLGWQLSLLPSGALELQWAPTATVVATSATGVIAADSAWHMLDFAITFDGTTAANNVASVWLDDSSLFSSVSNGNHTLARTPRYGSVPASGGGNCDLDDLSIRDSLGTTNNTRGGAGEGIALLLPTADSSIGNWTTGAGGTTSLFDAVNNTPPTGAASGTATSQIKNVSKTVPSAYTATLSVSPIPAGATMRGGCAQAWFGSSQTKAAISGSIAFAGGTAATLASSLSAAAGAWPSGWNADASSLAVTELSGSIPASYTVALTKTTSSTSDLQACQIYAYVLYDHGVTIVNKSASDSGTGNDATTSVLVVTQKSATDSSAVGSESASIATLLAKSSSDSGVGADSGTFYVGGTVEDTFNRTDNTSAIGTPSDGGDPWNEKHVNATTFGINNNGAYIATPSTASVGNVNGAYSDLLYRHVGLGNVQDVTFVIFGTYSAAGNTASSNTAQEQLYIGYDPDRKLACILRWYMYSNPQGTQPSISVSFWENGTFGGGTFSDPIDPSVQAYINLMNGASTTIRVRYDFRRGILDVYQDGRWALHVDSSNPAVANIKFSEHGAYVGWGPYAPDETNLPMTYHRLDQFDAIAMTVRAALIEPSDAGGNTDSATGSESQTVGVPIGPASDSATGNDATTSIQALQQVSASDSATGTDSSGGIVAATPLTLYLDSTAATTTGMTVLAAEMDADTSALTAAAPTTKVGRATGFDRVSPRGSTATWASGVSLPTFGSTEEVWIWETSTIEGQQLLAGDATGVVRLTASSAFTADVYVRIGKRDSSGVYTLIATMTATGQTIGTGGTNVAVSTTNTNGSSFSTTTFNTGDRVVVGIVLNITGAGGSNTGTVAPAEGAGANLAIATPGYAPVPTTPISGSDSGVGDDSTTSITVLPTASDAGTGSDATASIAATLTTTDAGSGGEAVSLIATVTHAETAAGADAVVGIALARSDSATGSDATTSIAVQPTATDSATGGETATLIATVTNPDSGTGNDGTASISATPSASDAGSGAETPTSISLARTDTGSGADSAAINAPTTASDTATGSESIGARGLSISDAGTGAEASSVAAALAASDAATGTDAPTSIGTSGSDTGSGADSLSIAAVLATSDTGAGGEVVGQIGLAASDTGTGTDSGSASPTQQLVTGSDSGTGAEGGSIAATLSNTDTATGSEAAGLGLARSDSGSGADTAAINATVTTSDTSTGTESVGGLALVRSDTGTGSEAVAGVALTAPGDTATGVDVASVAAVVSQADSGAGSETGSIAAALATSDSSAGADATASIAATLTAAETSSGSDSAALAVAQSTSDSGTGAEVPVSIGTSGSNTGTGADQAVLSATVAGSDAGAGAEAVALGLSSTEAASGVDSAALAATLVASDTAAGTDTTGTRGLAGSDTGSGSDTSAISSTTSSTDAATGTDVGSIAAAVSRSDSATGSDTAAVAAATTASDAASGADSGQIAASVTSSDSGMGADSGTLGVPVFGSDSGAGVDLVSLFATVTAQELAVAAEDQALLALLTDVDMAVGADSYTVIALPFSVDTGTGADVVNLVAFSVIDTAQGFDLVGSAGALKRDIEVFLGDRYVTVTIGEPFLQDIAAGVPFDRIAFGDPVMWNITFAEALDRVAVSERDEVLAVGERLDPITLGTPGL